MDYQTEDIYIDPNEIGKDPAADSPPLAAQIMREKYKEYQRGSKRHKLLYYTFRLAAGLSAALLPFVIGHLPVVATVLSVVVVVCTVFDIVLDPKSKWALYSRATDLLSMAELKRRGEYDKYKDALEVLLATEHQALAGLKDLEDVLKKVERGDRNDGG